MDMYYMSPDGRIFLREAHVVELTKNEVSIFESLSPVERVATNDLLQNGNADSLTDAIQQIRAK